jgi:hypothetical protein
MAATEAGDSNHEMEHKTATWAFLHCTCNYVPLVIKTSYFAPLENETCINIFYVQQEPKVTYPPPQGDLTMETVVKARNGSVLGKGSILKMYFFSGQKRSSNENFQGAPHVFKVLLCNLNVLALDHCMCTSVS